MKKFIIKSCAPFQKEEIHEVIACNVCSVGISAANFARNGFSYRFVIRDEKIKHGLCEICGNEDCDPEHLHVKKRSGSIYGYTTDPHRTDKIDHENTLGITV